MVKHSTATLGFDCIGPNRELKFALEKYWRKAISAEDLLAVAKDVEAQAWKIQCNADIDRIAVGDYALYDNVGKLIKLLYISSLLCFDSSTSYS